MDLFPGMASTQSYTVQYNTVSKKSNIIVHYQNFRGLDKHVHLNDTDIKSLVKLLSDDVWWNRCKKLYEFEHRHNINFNNFEDSFGFKKDTKFMEYIYNANVNLIRLVPNEIKTLIKNMSYIKGYRINQSKTNNIRIMEIQDSLYYVQYDVQLKRAMLIKLTSMLTDNYMYARTAQSKVLSLPDISRNAVYTDYNGLGKIFIQYVNLISNDEWWIKINQFLIEAYEIDKEKNNIKTTYNMSYGYY
jgi:hypothetical protein